jgi:hypothetical protein
MRLAYHSTGSALSAYALDVWLAATKAAIGSVVSPGVLLNVSDPAAPWAFENETSAEDRATLGGVGWSKINHTRRVGDWSFPNMGATEAGYWRAWYSATQGGRVPFVVEMPLSGGSIAVRCPTGVILRLTSPGRWRLGGLRVEEVL